VLGGSEHTSTLCDVTRFALAWIGARCSGITAKCCRSWSGVGIVSRRSRTAARRNFLDRWRYRVPCPTCLPH
jgi:hypothetical protein